MKTYCCGILENKIKNRCILKCRCDLKWIKMKDLFFWLGRLSKLIELNLVKSIYDSLQNGSKLFLTQLINRLDCILILVDELEWIHEYGSKLPPLDLPNACLQNVMSQLAQETMTKGWEELISDDDDDLNRHTSAWFSIYLQHWTSIL